MSELKYGLNIQLFGEEDPSDPVVDSNPAPKTLQDILNEDPNLKAEYEESVRVQRMQVEAAKDAELRRAMTEQQRLAQLNEEERRQEELRMREETLASRMRELELRELKASASEMLVERNLPATLIDMVDFGDADTVKASIETLKKTFETSVSAKVQEIAQGTPTPGKPGTPAKPKAKTELENKVEDLKKRWRL